MFTQFYDVAADGSRTAFIATGSAGRRGVYLHDGTSLTLIADTSTLAPGAATAFDDFDVIYIDGDRVAIEASWGDRAGIVEYDSGTGRIVVDDSMLVDGEEIQNLTLWGIGEGGILFRGFRPTGVDLYQDNISHLWIENGGAFSRVAGDDDFFQGYPVWEQFGAMDGNYVIAFLKMADLDVGITRTNLYRVNLSPNEAPTANAGADQSLHAGGTVYLDGSQSFDDNTAPESLIYEWQFVGTPPGSTATLNGAGTSMPSFVADIAGTYVVQLVVTDELAASSTPDTVMISSDNMAPSANAGEDLLVLIGDFVSLDGTASSDPENDFLTYDWQIVSAPAGSSSNVSASTSPVASFVPDLAGDYLVSLTVSDELGPSFTDIVTVTAADNNNYAATQIVAASQAVRQLPRSAVTNRGNQIAMIVLIRSAMTDINTSDAQSADAQSADAQGTSALFATRTRFRPNEYHRALNRLDRAIRRTDGCSTNGFPDRRGRERDWIVDCGAQLEVEWHLREAVRALTN